MQEVEFFLNFAFMTKYFKNIKLLKDYFFIVEKFYDST